MGKNPGTSIASINPIEVFLTEALCCLTAISAYILLWRYSK